MKIKAVKFNEKGFMTQPFAMGGEDGMENFDAKVRYRSCLQNYLIDTGTRSFWWTRDCRWNIPGWWSRRTRRFILGAASSTI